jgi:imidazoleglycerol-phosphate dehydratase
MNRYGCFTVVMDKVAVEAAIDIGGRPSLQGIYLEGMSKRVAHLVEEERFDDTDFTFRHALDFLESFLQHAGISLVYTVKSAEGDVHHVLEALFKALGKALDQATQIDPRRKGIPSTKGIID